VSFAVERYVSRKVSPQIAVRFLYLPIVSYKICPDLEELGESDVTDYEAGSDEDVLSDEEEEEEDAPDTPPATCGTKRTLEEESVEVVSVLPSPVKYNASKYFKKKVVYQHVEVAG